MKSDSWEYSPCTCESIHVVAFVENFSDADAIITFGIIEVVVQEIHIHSRFSIFGNRWALVQKLRITKRGCGIKVGDVCREREDEE